MVRAGERINERVFEERQRFPRAVFLIIAAVETGSIVMCTALLIATNAGLLTLGIFYATVVAVGLVIVVPVLRTWVDDRGVGWNWMPFGRGRIRWDEIETVEIEKVDALGKFGGWGPKFTLTGHPRSFGLIASGPWGIRIKRLGGKRATVITSHRPEELAEAILERLVASGVVDG